MADIKIGIRQLVEFVLRAGDLNEQGNSQNTALIGARIHRQLQKERSADYQKEYYVKRMVDLDGDDYVIDGRADGIIADEDHLWIEEIKTSDPAFKDLSENTLTLYWAQAKVYGAILTQDLDYEKVTLRLTYYQRPTDEITTEEHEYTREELREFFDGLVAEYEYWIKLRNDWRIVRNDSIKDLSFPFSEYRNGQRDLAVAVYKTILTEQRLFVEAPTGTGKTISTLFPTVKAVGEEQIDRIFYLTAKQSTRKVAEDATDLMVEQGLKIKSITLTAKDKMIFPEEVYVKPENNPYMVGYYDRVKDGLKDVLENENQLGRENIQAYAKKHMLDPFEFSLDLSLFCDLIICDYNYLFDPMVYLQRFFAVEDKNNFFLIDEAHNLVSRSRSMYSATLTEQAVLDAESNEKTSTGNVDKKLLKKRMTQVDNEFQLIRNTFDEQGQDLLTDRDPLSSLERALLNFNEAAREWLPKQPDNDFTDSILELFFASNKYLKISEFFDESYRLLISKDENRNLVIQEQILDPSPYLDESLSKGRGAIFFSATLSPVDYYQDTLGSEDGLVLQMDSPFADLQQNIIVTSYVNTKYAFRQQNIPNIMDSIEILVQQKSGHYLIFCPSYGFMNEIVAAFEMVHPEIDTIVQNNQMNDADRREFMERFENSLDQTLVGFAVLGGLFSEGIDLTEDQLIGVGIVSVGLPGLSEERSLLQEYFDEKNGHGFEYAYQLPGMNHVLQAAGRLIRTSRDRGNVVLMDQRFGTTRYLKLFPKHWHNFKRANSTDQLKNIISDFWKNED